MLGLYIHWPFCLSKCIYCDFGSKVITQNECNNSDLQEKYYKCLQKQLYYFAEKINKIEPFTTIYFGGGTPSLLKPEIVDKIITDAKNIYGISNDYEITLEANPTSFEIEKFKSFKDAGINRISLGIQSMHDNNLLWLGRKHNVKQAVCAIQEIKKLFSKWSFDLIYGLPKQTLDEWIEELKKALLLNPQHISLYTLIVDEQTPLGKMVKLGNIIPKTDDELADFYNLTNEFIEQNSNLQQYEVSNYAISGFESQHNLNYWKSYDYIGIGAGAHGRLQYNDGRRYELSNIFNPTEWQKNIQNDGNGLRIEHLITQQEQAEEILLMGLRTKYGINLLDIQKRFNLKLLDFIDIDKLKKFEKENFLIYKNNNLTLTKNGLVILDEILRQLLK